MTRRRNRREVENRITALETGARLDGTEFLLEGGGRASIRRRDLPEAIFEAATGVNSFRASVLLHAESARDGNRLFEITQSLAAGPARMGKTLAELEAECTARKKKRITECITEKETIQ